MVSRYANVPADCAAMPGTVDQPGCAARAAGAGGVGSGKGGQECGETLKRTSKLN